MRLKVLEISGFKSFPDKTRLQFGDGITAIVGPNGCGKTNLLDALRWVMGEQGFSLLRCDRTEELIFSGSGDRSPMGYAEVKLLLESDRPEFGAEVEVRRRFFRAGVSEYLLNRQPCKLRDIQDLFSSFGGGRAYATFDQTSIREVIRGGIRPMLEEAAQVARYRERREESERKLSLTEADLLRLSDVIRERERMVQTLRRQARQLAFYNQVKAERDQLRLTQLKLEYEAIRAQLSKRKQELEALVSEEARHLSEIQQVEEANQLLKEELRERRALEEQALRLLHEREARRSRLKVELKLRREQLTSLAEEIGRLESELPGIDEASVELDSILEQRRRSLSEVESAIDEIRARLESQELRAQEEELTRLRSELRKAETELRQGFEERQARIRRSLELEAKHEELHLQRLRVDSELSELNLRGGELSRAMEELNSQITRLADRLKTEEDSLVKLRSRQAELEVEGARLEEDHQRLEHQLRGLEAELFTLRSRLSRDQERRLARIRREATRLSSSIRARHGMEKALEAALYHLMDCFIVGELPGVEDLDRSQRWQFLIPGLKVVDRPTNRPDHPGVLGPLSDFVELRPPPPPFILHLLQEIWVVAEGCFKELIADHPGGSFVTPGGLANLGPLGVVVVEPAGRGRLGWEEELSSKEAEFTEVSELKKGIERELLRVEAELREVEKAIRGHEVTAQNLYRTQSELRGQLKTIEHLADETTRRKEAIAREGAALDLKLEQGAEELRRLNLEIAEMDEVLKRVEQGIEEIETEIRAREAELILARNSLNQELLSLAKLEERAKGLNNEIAHLIRAQKENRDRRARLEEELSLKRSVRNELESSLSAFEEELRAVEAEPLPDYDSARVEELVRRQEEADQRLSGLRRSLEQIRLQLLEVRLSCRELENREVALRQTSWTEFQRDITEYEAGRVEDLERRLSLVERRLRLLSRVNPLAQEDYERERQALSELILQRADIEAARQNLRATIEEIDERVAEEFRAKFEAVRAQFRSIFTQLFEGGETDLVLTDPKDLWGSPIEIVARPKGKNLKRLEQLSDGEKALLALSLLFAMYRTSPAPFCFLDEVDAALDDANVVRFVKFLKELSRQTQIVVITHNRYTIEQAQYIYGVTMEQPGISRVVSVRVSQLEPAGIERKGRS